LYSEAINLNIRFQTTDRQTDTAVCPSVYSCSSQRIFS